MWEKVILFVPSVKDAPPECLNITNNTTKKNTISIKPITIAKIHHFSSILAQKFLNKNTHLKMAPIRSITTCQIDDGIKHIIVGRQQSTMEQPVSIADCLRVMVPSKQEEIALKSKGQTSLKKIVKRAAPPIIYSRKASVLGEQKYQLTLAEVPKIIIQVMVSHSAPYTQLWYSSQSRKSSFQIMNALQVLVTNISLVMPNVVVQLLWLGDVSTWDRSSSRYFNRQSFPLLRLRVVQCEYQTGQIDRYKLICYFLCMDGSQLRNR